MPRPKVSFTTLGCRLNQAESDAMGEELSRRGFVPCLSGDTPDVVVVNTCTVTREATKGSRAAIRRAARSYPDARLVVVGCYAVSDRADIEAIEGVDAILDNEDKERFADALAGQPVMRPLLEIGMRSGPAPVHRGTARVRANLKMQTGCDEWCSFCIIPTTRGPLRSVPADTLVEEAEKRVALGARELVLTGVHLGKYAYDTGGDERQLVGVLSRLLDIEGVRRIRLSSILSRHLTDELIELMAAEPRMCRYLHVPMQAGDDQVLEAMNRPYRMDDYTSSVLRAKERISGLALATDIIVGFPGESADAFEATLAAVARVEFSKLHVFRYSARPGTTAAAMSGPVSPEIKKERSKRLIDLGNAIRARFLADHLREPLHVLVEDERLVDGTSICSGQTDDFVRVWFEGAAVLGEVVSIQGARVRADGIEGRLVENQGPRVGKPVELISARR